jgi:predicted molibdopterin-dependent oxidoreductase YjgC
VYSEKRLSKPLVRKDGAQQTVGWDEALGFVADKLKSIKAASGASSLAALGSERLTNEEAYVFNRFVRTVLETPNLDHSGGFAYRALVDGIGQAFGYAAGTNAIREIRNADVVLLLGSDLTETHPVAKNEVVLASGRRKAKVIVVDSIRTKLTDRRPSLFLHILPGTEHLVANAMLKYILDEGLFDKAALDLKAEGLDALQASLQDYTLDKVSEITGVDAELIRTAAKDYAQTPNATIILSLGMNRLGDNVELAKAAANLALVTGHVGKESAGVHLFGEKANAQGAIDMGLGPDLLPGCCAITDDAARAKFEKVWGSAIPKEKGLSASEILAKAETGEIRALYIVGENPLDNYPDRDQVERALSKLELLVVQDLFESSTAKMAHAVLPVTSFIEKTGTFTSSERLIQRVKPVQKVAGAKSDLEIFTALAAMMGKPGLTYSGPDQIMEEIASLVDAYKGVSYDRLNDQGLAWPCVDSDDPGKAMLYEGGFPGGKANLLAAGVLNVPEGKDSSMMLIPGVVKFHSGSLSTWSDSMLEVCPDGYAEMSYRDMIKLGLQEGDAVKLTTPAGASIEVKVKPTRRAMEGFVIVPQHFPEVKLNKLTRWGTPIIKIKAEKV